MKIRIQFEASQQKSYVLLHTVGLTVQTSSLTS